MTGLVARLLQGDVLALSRLISLAERRDPACPQIMQQIQGRTGQAHVVGFTGPPGGGKSTLVDRLTGILRRQDATVGILAVDPSSPFSGGALLGDRIRMQQHYLDDGVFIRSMATRGSRGGLPWAARDAIKLLDASGKKMVLVESVGVGQTELDIMEAVDTVVVVLVPESGDAIQTMKAGILEIADILVVNKADRPGAYELVADLKGMLALGPRRGWPVPVLAAQALEGTGLPELAQAVAQHHESLEASGDLARRRRAQRRGEFLHMVEERFQERLTALLEEELRPWLERVEAGELDPYSAAQEVMGNLLPPKHQAAWAAPNK